MIIYKVTSKSNNKSYIGKTSKTLDNRLREHIQHANNKNIKTTHFHNALLKYGLEGFTTEIVESNLTKDNIDEREKYWISVFNAYNDGYNMTFGGDGTTGYKQTLEHKEKIRLKNLGSKRTEEQKKNISIAHINSDYIMSEETRNKLRDAAKENKNISQKVVCPFCNKEGGNGAMKQWHFEHCKENPDYTPYIRKTRVNSQKSK